MTYFNTLLVTVFYYLLVNCVSDSIGTNINSSSTNNIFDKSNIKSNNNIFNDIDNNTSPLLENLEDIEALSYFLLSTLNHEEKCRFNSHDPIHGKKEDNKWCNLSESSLFRFFEDLRRGTSDEFGQTFNEIHCPNEVDAYIKLHSLSTPNPSNSPSLSTSQSSTSSVSSTSTTTSATQSFPPGSPSSLSLSPDDYRSKLMAICNMANQCPTNEQMLNIIRKAELTSSSESEIEDTGLRLSHSIVKLCPVILFKLYDPKCSSNLSRDENLQSRPSVGSVWGFSILFVTIISFCSLVGVMIMPFIDKDSFTSAMNLLEGLAVGSLVGSSLFHLIPQAFDLVIKYPSHDFLWKALIIFGGIYLFFWSERIMKIVSEFKRKKKLASVYVPTSNDPSNDSSNLASGFNAMKHVYFRDMGDDDASKSLTMANGNMDKEIVHNAEETTFTSGPNNNATATDSVSPSNHALRKTSCSTSSLNKHFHSHIGDTSSSNPGEQNIATVAWMIILGDGLHNFIDGLSVGAAFSNSILTGISTSVAVICEEFPHELGDFAVLISSGMTLRQAIGYNFLSACTCYLGMILGIIIGDFAAGSTYIFALAGGMFLYIALVDMMAELSASLDEAMARSTSSMIKALILQNVGILLGVATLFLLAKYSSHINFEGLAPFDQSEMPLGMYVVA